MSNKIPVIKVPQVRWALGDTEQTTDGPGAGVTTVYRPIYYRPPHQTDMNAPMKRVGSIDPDYAEPLMKALSKAK